MPAITPEVAATQSPLLLSKNNQMNIKHLSFTSNLVLYFFYGIHQTYTDYGVALLKVLLEQRLEWLKRPMCDLHVLLHLWHLKIDASMFGMLVAVAS